MPGEKTQGNHALMRQVKEMHSVDDLTGRHHQIDDTEIVLQSVTDESDPVVDQESQFQIRRLERRQVFRRRGHVQIARLNARKFRQIVHHLILSGNVVVDEGQSFHAALPIHRAKANYAHILHQFFFLNAVTCVISTLHISISIILFIIYIIYMYF